MVGRKRRFGRSNLDRLVAGEFPRVLLGLHRMLLKAPLSLALEESTVSGESSPSSCFGFDGAAGYEPLHF